MTRNDDRGRERGSRSPGSGEAREQGMSGAQGGSRAERSGAGDGERTPQGSGRVENRGGERPGEGQTGFAAGHAPSEQGESGHPSPHVIARGQQGIGARSGNRPAHGDRGEEEAQRGEPRGEHARHGRQSVSGDRPRE